MRIYKYISAAALVLGFALAPCASVAQESSLGTYSPYSMYGLGNLTGSPLSAFSGMGGTSIGFRNGGFDTTADFRLNLSNPASLSSIPAQTFIFDVGMAGSNVYASQQSREGMLRTSFNTFNFNNFTIAFPLVGGKLSFAASVSPYSEVGYKIHRDDDSHLADLGVVRYFYDGQGNITEGKAAVGMNLFRNLSIGVEANYLFGNIDRLYEAEILPYTGTGEFNSLSASTNEKVGRVFAAFGAQYTPVDRPKTRLTLGATYRLGGELKSTVRDYIPSNNVYDDVIRLNEYTSPTYMPQRIGAGFFFHRPKWALGGDYIYEAWGDHNRYDELNDVGYVNTNTFKAGVRYTPNRYDIRGKVASFFNRMTYKAGFRYGNNYMEFRGLPMNESAVSFGVDIPFKATTVSNLSINLEYSERGRIGTVGTPAGDLVKERYFKINVGVMLFGSDYDYWFRKYKYN
jgi:hypothetical protein